VAGQSAAVFSFKHISILILLVVFATVILFTLYADALGTTATVETLLLFVAAGEPYLIFAF